MSTEENKQQDSGVFRDELIKAAEENNRIDPAFYQKYEVKRGLRNSNGSGVLVGLTRIGNVHGFVLDEGEKTPVEGKLQYRGISVADIVDGYQAADRFGFEETAYLLLFGQLPNAKQLERFETFLGEKRILPDGFTEDVILSAPSTNIMNKVARTTLACYSYDDNPDDNSVANVLRQSMELIARFPTMMAYGYQAKSHYHNGESLFIHHPQPELSTAENILHLTRPDSQYTKLEAQLLDLSLVLHAEHGGGNNSSFTTHVISSSDTDTYSAIAGAIGSLKGSKHGGANIRVMEMFEDIKANVKNWSDQGELRDYLAKIIRKEAYDRSGLIYGMGHAIYTLSDPRAVILKEQADLLAKEKNREEEFQLYKDVEKLSVEVFADVKKSDKVISANVDFYSGFVYDMLNIPMDLYTPLFAAARIVGWCAHRIEEIVSGGRILRPAYKSVTTKMPYVPVDER